MRFLHTSDWHLGQTLHHFERSHEHQRFLDWLLDTIVAEQAEGLLIAGDVFDTANPSAASQRQFYRFLQQAKTCAPHLNIVIIAGNHDSPGRLEAPAPLLEELDIAVVGNVRRLADGEIDLERLVLPLKNRAGAIAAWCLAIPFLRPGDVPRVETQGDAYMEGMALLYRQALELALRRREPGQAIVALGHCHMTGGEISADSERRIVIGGAEALPASAFAPAIAYAALGHLHLAQRVGQQEHVRYCGSPLPMSFAEIGYAHQILRVDLDGEAVRGIDALRVPRTVELLRIPPQPAPVDDVLAALHALDLPAPSDANTLPYLEVRVRLDAPEPGLRSRVEAALEGKPVRLARIETTTARADTTTPAAVSLDDLERLRPDDIFKQLYHNRFGSDAPTDQLAAFAELLLDPADKTA
ncbi:exonuclease subunit SbcD [Noviherbaspirillum cavernae]|uniref:Nuclease SbcCD subunit D n=1 Tax=Noviherbaspirillum cavernae TaxID=2320862 RepID=A0A418WWM8_9BURK|nr:exonuclease SbcCD subunit D C-terminal domain-containing protein [Noviherbaspirillum cavernae]RJF97053.1 exonuclease subunit SbcD [Noviherbaspirillum cavernae]